MLPDLRFFVGAALLAGLVGMAGLGLFAAARQSKMGPLEASRSRAFADHAEWNQFYEADSVRRFVGLGRKAELAQPADAAPENRGETINSAPVAPAVLPPEISEGSERQAAAPEPAASPAVEPSAIAALPAQEPPSAPAISAPEQPRESAQAATSLPAIAATPDRPDGRGTNTAVPTEPTWDQEPWDTTASIAASETSLPGALALPSNSKDGVPTTPHSTAPSPATARANAAAPLPPVRIGAPVRRSDPEPEPPQVMRQPAPGDSLDNPYGWR